MNELHPQTGRRYIYALPHATDPTFRDWYLTYSRLSEKLPWLSVAGEERYRELKRDCDERTVLITVHDMEHYVPGPRRAKVFFWYCDTVGSPKGMIPYQKRMYFDLLDHAHFYDGVFVHEPFSLNTVALDGIKKVKVLPAGYDSSVMGVPDWSGRKEYQVVTYGYVTGIREWAIPALQQRMRRNLTNLNGWYGSGRQSALNRARAILYIPHSIGSFASFRLWQAIGSSAVLFLPPVRTWPAEVGKHYIEIPEFDRNSIGTICRAIHTILKDTNYQEVAETAHRDLSIFTPEYCVNNYLIPKIEEMLN